MSEKPICRIQFESSDEYWTLVKMAANHDMKLPDFVRACTIKVANEVFAQQDAARAAQEKANEESTPADDNSEATSPEAGEAEAVSETSADPGAVLPEEDQGSDQ